MSIKSFLRKYQDSGSTDIHHCCFVHLLDDANNLTVTYGKNTQGQEVFDDVCSKLNLLEKSYFGFRFTDSNNDKRWLELSQSVIQQLKHLQTKVLYFRVRYYPSDPMKLKEEITKYFVFLQLRRDLAHGRLICSVSDSILLAAHIIQCLYFFALSDNFFNGGGRPKGEMNACKIEEITADVVSSMKLLPRGLISSLAEITSIQKNLQCRAQADIEQNFLDISSRLKGYGFYPHNVRDESGKLLILGVSHAGISTFKEYDRLYLLSWSVIVRLDYERKRFLVYTVTRKKKPYVFQCWTVSACKLLWKNAVDLQNFYTLQSSAQVSTVHSSGSLLRRHSTYRFRGRTEVEASEEDNIRAGRFLPEFRRSMINVRTLHLSLMDDGAESLPGSLWASNNQSFTDSILSEPLINYRYTYPPSKHPSSSTLCDKQCGESLPDNPTPAIVDATDPPTPTSPVSMPMLFPAPAGSTAEKPDSLPCADPQQGNMECGRPEVLSENFPTNDVNGQNCVEPSQPVRCETRKNVAPRFGFVLVLSVFLVIIAVAMLVIFDVDAAANFVGSLIQEPIACLESLCDYLVNSFDY